jgi:hypothetical protein
MRGLGAQRELKLKPHGVIVVSVKKRGVVVVVLKRDLRKVRGLIHQER